MKSIKPIHLKRRKYGGVVLELKFYKTLNTFTQQIGEILGYSNGVCMSFDGLGDT